MEWQTAARLRGRSSLPVLLVVVLAGLLTLSGPTSGGLPRLVRPLPPAAPVGLVPPDLPRATPPSTTPGAAVPAAPAPAPTTAATPPVFPPVQHVQPQVAVTTTTLPVAAAADRAREVEGVTYAAAVLVGTVPVGGRDLTLAAVDPRGFRPFTPEVTAEAGLELGSTVPAGPDAELRIGAFATNGTPPVADGVVALDRAAALGLAAAPTTVLVALDPATSPDVAAEALAAHLDGEAEVVPDPRRPHETVVPSGGITPENVWDHLALCESSGDWGINTGNGYYGGLQFLPESWALVGGTGLPHQHSREEQIHRATLLWQIQGWEAWPQCARRLGLLPP